MADYLTVAKAAEHEEVVKGSRFIARVLRIESVAEARERLEHLRRRSPDASHHCWAYRLGDTYRFSDDGEPGGTAGRPMLEVILKRELDHVLAVVTRTFGGIKLGAGGLARAYGGTLAKALDTAGVLEVKPRCHAIITAPFAFTDALHRLLEGWPGVRKGEASFSAAGLRLELWLDEADVARLRLDLAELTRGRGELKLEGLEERI